MLTGKNKSFEVKEKSRSIKYQGLKKGEEKEMKKEKEGSIKGK